MAAPTKPFFFRLEPSQLLSALIQVPEQERGAWITQVAIELATGTPTNFFTKSLFDEASAFKQQATERSRLAGLASAERRRLKAISDVQQKSTDVQQKSTDVQQKSTEPNPEAVTEAVTKRIKPLVTYSDDFLAFWEAYPKKTAKGSAWQEWQKAKPPLTEVLKALEWQCVSKKWIEGFILDPERYIKKRCWEDEPAPKGETRQKEPIF
jgi:hypothetical protein